MLQAQKALADRAYERIKPLDLLVIHAKIYEIILHRLLISNWSKPGLCVKGTLKIILPRHSPQHFGGQ